MPPELIGLKSRRPVAGASSGPEMQPSDVPSPADRRPYRSAEDPELARVPAPPRRAGPVAQQLLFGGLLRKTIGSAFVIALVVAVSGWLAVSGELSALHALVPLVAGLSSFAWIVRAVVLRRRTMAAFRDGVPVRARVVSRRRRYRSRGAVEAAPLVLTWQFEVGGKAFRGSLESRDERLLSKLFPTDELVVLYVPEAPAACTAWVNEAALRPVVDPASLGAAAAVMAAVPSPPRKLGVLAKKISLASTGEEDTRIVKGGAALAVAVVLALVWAPGGFGEVALMTSAVPCAGVVTVRDTEDSTVRSNGRDATRIEYRYTYGGQAHEGTIYTTSDELIARALPGTPLALDVSASFPSIARVRGEGYSMFGFSILGSVTLFLVFACGIPGLVVIVPPLRAARRRRRAYREGTPAPGRVVTRELDPDVEHGRRRGVLEYEYTVDGQSLAGTLTSWNHKALAQAVPRDDVVVLHLPEDPRVHAVWVADDFDAIV